MLISHSLVSISWFLWLGAGVPFIMVTVVGSWGTLYHGYCGWEMGYPLSWYCVWELGTLNRGFSGWDLGYPLPCLLWLGTGVPFIMVFMVGSWDSLYHGYCVLELGYPLSCLKTFAHGFSNFFSIILPTM